MGMAVMGAEGRGRHLRALIASRGIPRNQAASLSGLTNTYIRDLENDVIQNVPRGNLIALAVALNLGLPEADELLRIFDRAPLTPTDVPAFLAVASRLRVSTALHACHNVIYELVLAACVAPGAGRIAIVNDRPTGALRPLGYRSYFDRVVLDTHPIYAPLVEAVGELRRERLLASLRAGARVEHVLSLPGLRDYARAPCPAEERRWRLAHIGALAALLREAPGFDVCVTTAPPNVQYTLVAPTEDPATFGLVAFEGLPSPRTLRTVPGRLMGFATASPATVASFAEDLQRAHALVAPEQARRGQVIEVLERLAAGQNAER